MKEKIDYLINQFMERNEGNIIECHISNAVTNSLISISVITTNRLTEQNKKEYILEEITNKLIIPYEEVLDCYSKIIIPKEKYIKEAICIAMKSGVIIEFFCCEF